MDYIKLKCVGKGCKSNLIGDYSHYERYGNFCMKCISEINRSMKLKEMQGRTLQKRLIKFGLLKN